MVAAAASLHNAVEALRPAASERGLELVLNVAGSNVLAQQIAATSAADVFLSADEAWVDDLERRGRLRTATRRAFLSNRLLVLGHGPPLERLEDLADGSRAPLVLADPNAVPAGRYARAALEKRVLADGSTLWDRLADRVVPVADVRAALALIDARDDAQGIVYATDAALARSAHRIAEIPASLTPPIRYVAVAIADRPDPNRADRFLALLASAEARAVLEGLGFLPIPP